MLSTAISLLPSNNKSSILLPLRFSFFGTSREIQASFSWLRLYNPSTSSPHAPPTYMISPAIAVTRALYLSGREIVGRVINLLLASSFVIEMLLPFLVIHAIQPASPIVKRPFAGHGRRAKSIIRLFSILQTLQCSPRGKTMN